MKLQRSWKKHVVLIISTCMMQIFNFVKIVRQREEILASILVKFAQAMNEVLIAQSLCKNFTQ